MLFSELTQLEPTLAEYFDETALCLPTYLLRRHNISGHRFYYEFMEGGVPVFYPSVTTLTRAAMGKSPEFVKWIASYPTYDMAMEYVKERADYGTFLHIEIARSFKEGWFDFGAHYPELDEDSELMEQVLSLCQVSKAETQTLLPSTTENSKKTYWHFHSL